MTTHHRSAQLLLVLVFLFMALIGGVPAGAQCSVAHSWPSYTVVRGDTLYRIARRFGTTVTVLQTNNCLSSTRIYAGQTLYVPPGAGNSTPVPNNTLQWYETSATFQTFENGFMIWLGNTGEIWVYRKLITSVKSRNDLTVHPVSEYGRLPSNSSVPPAGLVQPMFGFGKVWSNLSTYRTTLGWATQSETSYSLNYAIMNGQLTQFNLPNGNMIMRENDGFWSSDSTPSGSVQSVNIDQPTAQQSLLSGQSFDVMGRAAGLFEASFVLELRTVPSNTLLASAAVTYNAADVGLPGPWQTRLTPLSYTGAAELRAIYLQPRDGTPVLMTSIPVTFR
jgi:LysM repeat protein